MLDIWGNPFKATSGLRGVLLAMLSCQRVGAAASWCAVIHPLAQTCTALARIAFLATDTIFSSTKVCGGAHSTVLTRLRTVPVLENTGHNYTIEHDLLNMLATHVDERHEFDRRANDNDEQPADALEQEKSRRCQQLLPEIDQPCTSRAVRPKRAALILLRVQAVAWCCMQKMQFRLWCKRPRQKEY